MSTEAKKLKINKVELNKLAKKHSLKLLLLFGSQVNGKAKDDSDTDIAYLANSPLSASQIIDLNNDLVVLFSTDKVDQVDLQKANPLLLSEIAKNNCLIFGKQIDYIKFKAKAFRVFIDSASLFRLQDILMEKRHKLLSQSIYA